MLKEKVTIVYAIGDKLTIGFKRHQMCPSCKISDMCNRQREETLIIEKENKFKNGDIIEIGIEGKKVFLINILLFGIPIVVFIIFLAIMSNKGELIAFLTATLFLVFYYVFLRMFLYIKKHYFDFKFLRKL